jgi:hypothetical protein
MDCAFCESPAPPSLLFTGEKPINLTMPLMIEPKEERRVHLRRCALKAARIVYNNRASSIDCVVKNLSSHGALLLVPNVVGIPNAFELCIDGETACHSAHVVWRRNGRIGVTLDAHLASRFTEA